MKHKTACSVAVIIEAMEQLAPKNLAEDWDNPGLLTGNPANRVTGILTTLDITEKVVDEAIENGCEMIISHHPLIFRAIKTLRSDQPLGLIIEKIIANNISVYAAHTNLDIAKGGINDLLAEKLNLENVSGLIETQPEKLVKLVAFVPNEATEKVRTALADAGAGKMGNYRSCSYTMQGEGRFLPTVGANPYLGHIDQLECVAETRIEVIFPAKDERKIVKALVNSHPYEEPAYDLISLRNRHNSSGEFLGRIGQLPEPLTLIEFAKKISKILNTPYVRIVNPAAPFNPTIKKVAICSGAAAEYIHRAAFMGADAYVTGDVKYHDARQAEELGLAVIDAGHFPTENHIANAIKDYLLSFLATKGYDIKIYCDEYLKDAFTIVMNERT